MAMSRFFKAVENISVKDLAGIKARLESNAEQLSKRIPKGTTEEAEYAKTRQEIMNNTVLGPEINQLVKDIYETQQKFVEDFRKKRTEEYYAKERRKYYNAQTEAFRQREGRDPDLGEIKSFNPDDVKKPGPDDINPGPDDIKDFWAKNIPIDLFVTTPQSCAKLEILASITNNAALWPVVGDYYVPFNVFTSLATDTSKALSGVYFETLKLKEENQTNSDRIFALKAEIFKLNKSPEKDIQRIQKAESELLAVEKKRKEIDDKIIKLEGNFLTEEINNLNKKIEAINEVDALIKECDAHIEELKGQISKEIEIVDSPLFLKQALKNRNDVSDECKMAIDELATLNAMRERLNKDPDNIKLNNFREKVQEGIKSYPNSIFFRRLELVDNLKQQYDADLNQLEQEIQKEITIVSNTSRAAFLDQAYQDYDRVSQECKNAIDSYEGIKAMRDALDGPQSFAQKLENLEPVALALQTTELLKQESGEYLSMLAKDIKNEVALGPDQSLEQVLDQDNELEGVSTQCQSAIIAYKAVNELQNLLTERLSYSKRVENFENTFQANKDELAQNHIFNSTNLFKKMEIVNSLKKECDDYLGHLEKEIKKENKTSGDDFLVIKQGATVSDSCEKAIDKYQAVSTIRNTLIGPADAATKIENFRSEFTNASKIMSEHRDSAFTGFLKKVAKFFTREKQVEMPKPFVKGAGVAARLSSILKEDPTPSTPQAKR